MHVYFLYICIVKHPSLRVTPLGILQAWIRTVFKADREGYFINTAWKDWKDYLKEAGRQLSAEKTLKNLELQKRFKLSCWKK